MNETYKVRSIGGSLMVTLPQKLAKILALKGGDDVTVSLIVSANGLLIKPVKSETNGKKKR